MPTLLERFISFQTRPDSVRTEELRGASYTVIPAIGLVEGVLQGAASAGPELALADEFGDVPAAWDGRPVTMGHPVRDEAFVSANRPDVFETETVGFVFNTQLTGEKAQKLKMELWIETARMPKVEMDRLLSGKEIEVSTGFFADSLPFPGTFGDKDFESILVNIKPDHLAILAEGTLGACSFEDGCGAPRVNMTKDERKAAALKVKLEKVAKAQADHDEKKKGKKKKPKAKAAPKKNSSECSCNAQAGACACQEVKDNEGAQSIAKLKFQSKGKGTRAEAINQVVSGLQALLKENIMDKDTLISEIIAAEVNAFAAGDKDTLSKLSVEALKGILANEEEEATAGDEAAVKAAAEATEAAAAAAAEEAAGESADEVKSGEEEEEVNTDPPSIEDYIAGAPAEIGQVLTAGLNQLKAKQTRIISGIKANKANSFSDADLLAMSIEDLEKLAKFAKIQDYSGKGGPKANEVSELNTPKTYLGPRKGKANPFTSSDA